MGETMTGRTLAGRYQITGYLRPGRMGDIYVARRLDDNERVSVKLLDPGLFDQPEAVRRFERETEVTRKLRHPCSMQVLDHGKEQGAPWMVLEYVEGELLSEVIEEHGALGAARSARIAGQIALALQAAHELGVVHRDLQPDNVLLAKAAGGDVVKVREFGLARLEAGPTEEGGLTAVGVRIGTPTYMAPEYIEEFELDHRADLYALGVVLYEMLVGEPPFQGRPYKVMDLHLTAPVPRPSAKADVPAWLDDLVLKLMAKAPADRPGSAAEVAATIERGVGSKLLPEPRRPKAARPPPVSRSNAPDVDPILVNHIRQNTLSVRKGSGSAADLRDALIVERVAATSIAAEAGVRPGHLLELPDEPTNEVRSTEPDTRVIERRRYLFSSPDGAEQIELVATGMPLGVELRRPVEHVRALYSLSTDPSALVDLWRAKEWEELERLSWRTLTQQRGAASVLNTGLFARFLGAASMKVRNHPALVMYAAALIEQGRSEGIELVEEYRSKYAAQWPNVYDAIAHYYLGWQRARRVQDQTAADLLWQSYLACPLERTAVALEMLTRKKPEHRAWFGRRFPDYSLESVDRSTSAQLEVTLGRMDDAQLLLVCLLGGFRGNLDYDAFMHRYLAYAPWFPELLYGLHVVTTVTGREKEHPEHYRGEDLVIQAGLRLRVLEDYRAFVQRAVKPGAIPTIYAIDKQGVVVHEGQLHATDLWDALAEAGRRRMERLRG